MNTPIRTINDKMNLDANEAYQAIRRMQHIVKQEITRESTARTEADRYDTAFSHKEYWLRQSLKALRTADTYMMRAGSAYNSANLRDITDRS